MSQSYAGLWIRVLAFAADYLIIFLYLVSMTGISLIIQSLFPGLMQSLFDNTVLGQITSFLIVTLPVTLYFALLESSSYQATWGKHWQGLKVIHADGKQLSRTRSLCRTVLKFIPWELAHTCIWQINYSSQEDSPIIIAGFLLVWILVGVYVISLLISSKNQTLYDQLTKTHVIATK